MIRRLREHLANTGLIPEGSRVLVGWSGGADSTCLLLLLRELGYDVIAAHLDHGQRPESAAQSEAFARHCDAWEIPFLGGRADVPAISAARGIGLEEAGRDARYAFFSQGQDATGCDLVATGHTRSDLAETVLFHLARGSGMSGLTGIPAERDGIVRPLLIFSREETRAFCLEREIEPFEDPANVDLTGSRARIRALVLPELERAHPGAEATIARTAALIAEEDRFLDGAAAAALEHAERTPNGPLHFVAKEVEVVLDRRVLSALPAVLLKRALRLAVRTVGGTLDHAQVGRLAEDLAESRTGSLTCEGGRVVVVLGDDLEVRDLQASVPARYPLAPGDLESDEFGWRLSVDTGTPGAGLAERRSLAVELDRAKVKGTLYLRATEAGDRIAPYGFAGTRKLADLMSEAGLTASARKRIPVVCDLVGPVWLPGIALSGRVAKDDATAAVWRLALAPLEANL